MQSEYAVNIVLKNLVCNVCQNVAIEGTHYIESFVTVFALESVLSGVKRSCVLSYSGLVVNPRLHCSQ